MFQVGSVLFLRVATRLGGFSRTRVFANSLSAFVNGRLLIRSLARISAISFTARSRLDTQRGQTHAAIRLVPQGHFPPMSVSFL